MMGDIYYLSGDGKNKIFLDRHPYWLQTGDILDYEWTYTARNNKICGFQKEIAEKEFTISVFGNSEDEYGENWKTLHDVFELDVRNLTPGYLYFGNYYLQGYIISSQKEGWEYDNGIVDNTLRLVTDSALWIRELKKEFYPASRSRAASGLDYQFDYKYEYFPGADGVIHWDVDHFSSSDFQMVVYGPCVDPRILINGYSYQIFDTLENNDYLIIDSQRHTVWKYLANGTIQNLYDLRAKQQDVFEKIPAGNLTVNWNAVFGFDLALYLERSEPEWS